MVLRALIVLYALSWPSWAQAGTGDKALQAKLDSALKLVRETPGFEIYSQRLDAIRGKGNIKVAKLEGALAEVMHSDEVLVTKKLLRTKSVKFIASTLAHEAVHLAQDDSRYAYVEEIEFRAYQVGGRFKLKVGMEPTTLEKAAMRLPRSKFIREANTILTSYGGLKYRKTSLTFDRESLEVSTLSGLRELAKINRIKGAAKMSKKALVEVLVDRFNRGGLDKLTRRNLVILARDQGLPGSSAMRKAQLIKALATRLDAHRLGVYSYKELKLLAASRGIELRPLRSKKSVVKALVRSDQHRTAPKRRSSRTRHRARPRRTRAKAKANAVRSAR